MCRLTDLYRRFQSATLEHLQESIKGLFSNSVTTVCLSTIHRAKGVEANRVLLLDYDNLPMQWESQRSWQYMQEENLLYVALTRSKRDLVLFGELRDPQPTAQDADVDTIMTDPLYKQLLTDPTLDLEIRETSAVRPQYDKPQESICALVRCLAILCAKNQWLTIEPANIHSDRNHD